LSDDRGKKKGTRTGLRKKTPVGRSNKGKRRSRGKGQKQEAKSIKRGASARGEKKRPSAEAWFRKEGVK